MRDEKTIRLRVSEIREVAMKHPGMWGDFLKVGKLSANKDMLEISREDFEQINAHYFHGVKLGSALHAVLRPVVKVVDSVLGTMLEDCGNCAERELKLNDVSGGRSVGVSESQSVERGSVERGGETE